MYSNDLFNITASFGMFVVMVLGLIGLGGFSLIWGVLLQPEIQVSNEKIEFDSLDAAAWLWSGGEEWEEVTRIPARWDNMESSVLTAWTKEKVAPLTKAYVIAAQQPYPFSNTTLDELLM